MTKECPMCSEIMSIHVNERVDVIPGTLQKSIRTYREWLCPECDYFEEVDESELEEV